ncbi:MAG: Tol-Pal system subunit TolQ [Candidatus Puniceispirillum sp.]|nr:Tol-Pal system subunit TolQ [Candidatus Puniceispirillum sp.]
MWDMFWHADWIVQLVMLMLLAASFWCWTLIFSKSIRLKKLRAEADSFEDMFWSGGTLDALYDRVGSKPDEPLASVFAAAMREWRRATSAGAPTQEKRISLQQRIERIMQATITREVEDLERSMGFLASVGSTAPFVGLFGTVWGIMNSFQNIASSQSTNLAVVAPGIAEALLATALGLIAAIPAVLAYNRLSSEINRYANRLETFSQEFSTIVSRQLETAA